MNKKQLAGEQAVSYVEDGMILGLGTGSTVYWSIMKLGELVRKGLRVKGIPTSEETAALARQLEIPLTTFAAHPRIDVTIDGADAVTPDFSLIKGGGGALLREKLVANASSRMIVVIDDGKLAETFEGVEIPIEVVPFGWETTASRIAMLGGETTMRQQDDEPFVTDNHNYILDARFGVISGIDKLHANLKAMCGVVETGLFIGLADTIIIGGDDGVEEWTGTR